MYRFKPDYKDVQIVIKRPQRLTITDQKLRENQHLASFILDDPNYARAHGHIIEWTGDKPLRKTLAKKDLVIEVDVKKKPDSLSTSTEAPSGGQVSTQQEQPSISEDSQGSKQNRKQRRSQKQKQDVSEATKK